MLGLQYTEYPSPTSYTCTALLFSSRPTNWNLSQAFWQHTGQGSHQSLARSLLTHMSGVNVMLVWLSASPLVPACGFPLPSVWLKPWLPFFATRLLLCTVLVPVVRLSCSCCYQNAAATRCFSSGSSLLSFCRSPREDHRTGMAVGHRRTRTLWTCTAMTTQRLTSAGAL